MLKQLLEWDKSASIPHQDIRLLTTGIYKAINGLRNSNIVQSHRINVVQYDSASLTSLGPKI